MMKKRKQHYVWEYYLGAWAENSQIWCQRGEDRFKTNTDNVANRRDFYRLKPLTSSELEGLERFVIAHFPPHLRQIGDIWARIFQIPHAVQQSLAERGKLDAEAQERLDIAINNLEENLHSKIESNCIPILRALRAGQVESLSDDETYGQFALYLAMQFLRTPSKATAITEALGSSVNFDIDSAWGAMRTILATSIGYSLLQHKHSTRITILSASEGKEFITGDQPVINTLAVDLPAGAQPEQVQFYYPLGPKAALLMDLDEEKWEVKRRSATPEEISRLNKMLSSEAIEQLYARSESTLQAMFQ